jgi:small subunit ribosomal protein S19|tara:strand:+ start:38 stop:442 length:405 start_codon:yes stop_codon:yes gene_type:complete
MVEEVRVRSKEKKYRGKSIDELKELSVKESAEYLKSRSRRTILRNVDFHEKFVKNCEEKIKKGKKIRTHLRDMIIVPKLVGLEIAVHDGKSFQIINVEFDMIGHRLGEFALTRKRVGHSGAGVGATKGSRTSKK